MWRIKRKRRNEHHSRSPINAQQNRNQQTFTHKREPTQHRHRQARQKKTSQLAANAMPRQRSPSPCSPKIRNTHRTPVQTLHFIQSTSTSTSNPASQQTNNTPRLPSPNHLNAPPQEAFPSQSCPAPQPPPTPCPSTPPAHCK